MALSVTRTSRSLVPPSEQTPSDTLDLSPIDRNPILRSYCHTLHVYKHGPEAAKVIREALSKALVPYYPLAGRLIESTQGQLQVHCSGEGVWFVEAFSDSTLESVNYLDDSDSKISYDQLLVKYNLLLPDQFPEDPSREPALQMQVTQFACGGFVIGFANSHAISDGLGSALFLLAVAEMARGVECVSIPPVWQRDFFPPPQRNAVSPLPDLPPPKTDKRFLQKNLDISTEEILKLKEEFRESTGKFCSTFEVISARFWRHRTKAINFEPNTELWFVYLANCRPLLNPPLPQGFYGNCVFPVVVKASREFLMEASNIEVIKLMQESKANLRVEFAKYLNGEYFRNGINPLAVPLALTTVFVSDWCRLGFYQTDFGWGLPLNIVPVPGASGMPIGIVGLPPVPKKGNCLMTWCFEEDSDLQNFCHLMKDQV